VSFIRTSLLTAVALSLTLIASAGYAQDDLRKKGDKACGSDSRRMCSKFFGQGDMMVLGCLQENKVKLSRNCHKFLSDIGQLN
jgi:hypothetical protein